LSGAELSFLGLHPGDPLPTGGLALQATYQEGYHTGEHHARDLQPFFTEQWGIHLYEGTFNLHTDTDVELAQPRRFQAWMLCPIVLNDRAIGVVCRQNTCAPSFLEIVAPVKLRERLGLDVGDQIRIRILPGTKLAINSSRRGK
jgi:CTP-dependent riboflavin kinase